MQVLPSENVRVQQELMMRFDSTNYHEAEFYYGALRAVTNEKGTGNSEETILEFETPEGVAQGMEITVLTDGHRPGRGGMHVIGNAHTVRIKITGEWEGGQIKDALADLVHAFKLKATLE